MKSAVVISPVLAVLFILIPSLATALDPSGTVVASVPSARAKGQTGERILNASSDIFMGDRVITGARGEAQIRLADDTR
ncbi:MAG: hypothetical protein N2B03_02995, partial [Boseongicola sp.]